MPCPLVMLYKEYLPKDATHFLSHVTAPLCSLAMHDFGDIISLSPPPPGARACGAGGAGEVRVAGGGELARLGW